jgi:selenocysteine lyase/cysteine desulfurase
MDRRTFLRATGVTTAGLSLLPARVRAEAREAASSLPPAGDRPAEAWARDEGFWDQVIRAFAPAPDFTNLEYGYYCPAAVPVLEAELNAARRLHARASHYKRSERLADLEASRTDLADLAGVDPGEIAITRNATESLNILIHGIPLEAGDEIAYSDQDYGSMAQALRQRSVREGIILREVAIPLHPASDEEIVARWAAALTPRTRLLHVTHMINLTGQVQPVAEICRMAHARGVEVIVDAAHSFAHVFEDIAATGADYLGVSLHKWLCAPVGLGLLYVRRDKIGKVWPLLGDHVRDRDDIRKLERVGTRPDDHVIALREAIRFHRLLGFERKRARLRHLARTWTSAVEALPGVILNTPRAEHRHGAIMNIAIEGIEPGELSRRWFEEDRILTAGIRHAVVKGVRVTPGLPTPLRHLDAFAAAVERQTKLR